MSVHNTSLADGVLAADAAFDATCKRLLGERQVVARILADAVSGFEGTDPDVLARDCVAADVSYDVPLGRNEAGESHVRDLAFDETNPVPAEPDVGVCDPMLSKFGANASDSERTVHGPGTADAAFRDPGPALRLDTDDTTIREGSSIFDVRTRATLPGTTTLVELDLEGQGKSSPGYPLLRRAMFYCGRMLSWQGADIVAHSNYGALRRVVSIWVLTKPPKDLAGTAWRACMGGESLVGEPSWNALDVACAEVVVLCIGGDSRKRGGVLGMLDVLFAKDLGREEKIAILANEYGMMMTEEIEEGVQKMCTIGEAWREDIREEVTREVKEEITRDVTAKVTRDVTAKVTRDVTDKVTRDVTDKVTRDVTAKVTRKNIIANVRTLMETLPSSAAVALDLLKISGDDRKAVVAALDA